MNNIAYGVAMILPILIMLSGCDEPECIGPFPDREYSAGEIVKHKPTGESVRVISAWTMFGGSKCAKRKFRDYTIRFNDGAEISSSWEDITN